MSSESLEPSESLQPSVPIDAAESTDLDLLAASLRADLGDIAAFVEGLAAKLEDALPTATRVERVRQGFRGPKLVMRIAVDAGDERLELRRERTGPTGAIKTLRARLSGGIVLRTEALGIDDWLAALAAAVAAEAQRNARTRQVLERLLLDG